MKIFITDIEKSVVFPGMYMPSILIQEEIYI